MPTDCTKGWWLGELSWSAFVRRPGVRVHGDRALQRQMHRWFARYVFTAEALSQV